MSTETEINELTKVCDWAAHKGHLEIYESEDLCEYIFYFIFIFNHFPVSETLAKLKEYEKYEDRQNEQRRYLSCFILDKVNASGQLTPTNFKNILETLNELVCEQ
jgi:hypothetical protein